MLSINKNIISGGTGNKNIISKIPKEVKTDGGLEVAGKKVMTTDNLKSFIKDGAKDSVYAGVFENNKIITKKLNEHGISNDSQLPKNKVGLASLGFTKSIIEKMLKRLKKGKR